MLLRHLGSTVKWVDYKKEYIYTYKTYLGRLYRYHHLQSTTMGWRLEKQIRQSMSSLSLRPSCSVVGKETRNDPGWLRAQHSCWWWSRTRCSPTLYKNRTCLSRYSSWRCKIAIATECQCSSLKIESKTTTKLRILLLIDILSVYLSTWSIYLKGRNYCGIKDCKLVVKKPWIAELKIAIGKPIAEFKIANK